MNLREADNDGKWLHGLGEVVFRFRSYTPVPWLIVMIIFARPTLWSLLTGAGVVVIGELIRFWGVGTLGSESRTTRRVGASLLVTTGAFAHTRNPLYLGNVLIYTGAAVMSGAFAPWLPLLTLAAFLLQYHLIISVEEEHLKRAFGEAYRSYAENVPRLWPRPTPHMSENSEPRRFEFGRGLRSEARTLQAIAAVSVILVLRAFMPAL